MNTEQLQEFINWVNKQIEITNKGINDSQSASNYGREAQYEGMREAYLQLLRKLNSQVMAR